MAGTLIDDTERVEADRVRRAAETRFEIGFEQSAIGAAIADLEGIPIRVNPAVCRSSGGRRSCWSAGGGTSTPIPTRCRCGRPSWRGSAAGHDTYDDERRYLRPDGSVVWASTHVTLVRDERG